MTTVPGAATIPYIPFDRACGIPYYRQIYDGYRAAILDGRLRPGQRLPSTRALAAELQISRLPVLNAFEQLLHEGYTEGRVGAGTYVMDSIPDELARPIDPRDRLARPSDGEMPPPRVEAAHAGAAGPPDELGPLRVNLPALDAFPRTIWARLVGRQAKRLPVALMAYGEPAGYPPLREAIADYLCTARAVRCDADQVLIVSGSQMALQLCALALIRPGDTVCLEEPGYPGAQDAMRITGGDPTPVPVDDDGIDVAALTAQGARARVVYVTPSHQYPLGVSMTASRRLALLDWAQRNGSWIVEDDYDSEYRYASRPLGALQGMDTAGRVIYIGTFSKVLFPALRVGYIVVPPALVGAFRRLRESLDIFSPTLYQLVLTDFILEGHFARHLRRMRALYLGRRNALVEGLRDHAGDLLTPYNTDAGLHLTAFLPPDADDREVVRRAKQRGISATALSTFYLGKPSRGGLILGFGGADEDQIRRATRTLARVIREPR